MPSRRRFVANDSVAGAAGFAAWGAFGPDSGRRWLAAEPPRKGSTIRIDSEPIVCIAPQSVAEELLHAEGFADIRYEVTATGSPTQKLARDKVDLEPGLHWALQLCAPGGERITIQVVAGL